jgi:hypothetical protein
LTGVDLLSLYPEYIPPTPDSNLYMQWKDGFDMREKPAPTSPSIIKRPAPVPWTYHRYRIRSVDVLGRTSIDG